MCCRVHALIARRWPLQLQLKLGGSALLQLNLGGSALLQLNLGGSEPWGVRNHCAAALVFGSCAAVCRDTAEHLHGHSMFALPICKPASEAKETCGRSEVAQVQVRKRTRAALSRTHRPKFCRASELAGASPRTLQQTSGRSVSWLTKRSPIPMSSLHSCQDPSRCMMQPRAQRDTHGRRRRTMRPSLAYGCGLLWRRACPAMQTPGRAHASCWHRWKGW